jgi:hypothetical protein
VTITAPGLDAGWAGDTPPIPPTPTSVGDQRNALTLYQPWATAVAHGCLGHPTRPSGATTRWRWGDDERRLHLGPGGFLSRALRDAARACCDHACGAGRQVNVGHVLGRLATRTDRDGTRRTATQALGFGRGCRVNPSARSSTTLGKNGSVRRWTASGRVERAANDRMLSAFSTLPSQRLQSGHRGFVRQPRAKAGASRPVPLACEPNSRSSGLHVCLLLRGACPDRADHAAKPMGASSRGSANPSTIAYRSAR